MMYLIVLGKCFLFFFLSLRNENGFETLTVVSLLQKTYLVSELSN